MKSAITAIAAVSVLASSALAGDRKFTYSNDVTTNPKGVWEYEQWVTWKSYGSGKDSFDFRHELEGGLTDKLQIGIYLADWTLTRQGGKTDAVWKSSGVELIYNLSNPTTDILGSAIYGEVKLGEEIFKLEAKLLLQKNLGPWTFISNTIVEAEWEGSGYDEEIGVFEQTLGVSYDLSPSFSIGAEAKYELEYEGWSGSADGALYIGPVASYRKKDFFVATTVLFQATDIDSEPDVQTRMILGFHF
ncbi:MAG: hypothetical protein RL088_3845 [Verrucomicrobiota bacterium]|jgi:hypothetical protein